MSEIQRLEQKIDERSAATDKKLDQLIETMTTFIAFQARSEERHVNDREWKERFERQLDAQDVKISKVAQTANDANTQSLSNGRWINFGVALLTSAVIYIGKQIFDRVFGQP